MTQSPYDQKGYAEAYDRIYQTSDINILHHEFEVNLVSSFLPTHQKTWCDVACGTGRLLNSVPINHGLHRTGIDRSENMLNFARSHNQTHAEYLHADVLHVDFEALSYDLVTHFFYGYLHQQNLADVMRFIDVCCRLVDTTGDLLLGVCEPVGLYDRISWRNKLIYGGTLDVDAIIWSFTEPWSGLTYEHCIAPHPHKIIAQLEPFFETVEIKKYPTSSASGSWDRKLLVCRGKLP